MLPANLNTIEMNKLVALIVCIVYFLVGIALLVLDNPLLGVIGIAYIVIVGTTIGTSVVFVLPFKMSPFLRLLSVILVGTCFSYWNVAFGLIMSPSFVGMIIILETVWMCWEMIFFLRVKKTIIHTRQRYVSYIVPTLLSPVFFVPILWCFFLMGGLNELDFSDVLRVSLIIISFMAVFIFPFYFLRLVLPHE